MKNVIYLYILVILMLISISIHAKPASVETIEINGKLIDKIVVPGGYPPEDYEPQNIPLTRTDVIISGVPGFDWAYGCSATSAAMAMGYYDNNGYINMYTGPTNGGACPIPDTVTPYWTYTAYPGATCYECPLSATHYGFDGLGGAGHVDDYWIDINQPGPDPWIAGGVEHSYADCTGDYMGTSQWSAADGFNYDGGTTFWYYDNGAPTYATQLAGLTHSGINGIKTFVESRGYSIFNDGANYVCYNQYIIEQGLAYGFTFSQYQNEIDNNRPVLIQVEGHTMLGVGYNAATNEIIMHDTWGFHRNSGVYTPARMPWAGSYYDMYQYAVGVFVLDESSEPEPREYGDAPEDAIAYPVAGTMGYFPTCKATGPAGYIEHNNFGAFFGLGFDFETEGNAANCPNFNPNLYNQDECYNDGDAGLIMPAGFTITGNVGSETVVPCTTSTTSLGVVCQPLIWGSNIDINVTNNMPSSTTGYVNVLFDWNQDGQWANDPGTQCNSSMVPEHLIVNMPISNPYSGPLSGAGMMPQFTIGPNSGYVWVRFSITESQVPSDWDGTGVFEDGETEDYLIKIEDEQMDFGDLPDTPYQTLLASDGPRHIIDGITWMGAMVDADADGQPDSFASGDDLDGNDDEDGVTFQNSFVQGQTTNIQIATSIASGYLTGWIDWNGDGMFDSSSNEKIINDFNVISTTSILPINVPANTVNNTYARFRFSTVQGLSDQGLAPDGEVEDYKIYINMPIESPKQTNPQYPDPNGWDVNITEPALMADDWMCNETGWISDIHFWISVFGDEPISVPSEIINLHLSIHSDIPADGNPGSYSMPGELLWSANIIGESGLIMLSEGPVLSNWQGWLDPNDGSVEEYNHLFCYRIDIPELPEPFLQEEGTIYWLDISIIMENPEMMVGWKTTLDHWNDDAVWQPMDLPGTWMELIDPLTEESLDMAFVLTGYPLEEEDFGDLSDSYKTLLASDGARHTIDMSYFLGSAIDSEMDGQPGIYALDDDNDTAIDDEDGVKFTASLVQGMSSNIEVTASSDGYLNTWLDYNIDGDFDDAGEYVYNDYPLTSGLNTLQIDIPQTATAGLTAMRFRFTSYSGGVNYYGSAMNGEVEDYKVLINEPIEDTKMENPQFPDPAGIDVKMASPYILADDWMCSESGTIDDLHFWVSTPLDETSFAMDLEFIYLSVHSDLPADDPSNPYGYSIPNELLWETVIPSPLIIVNTEPQFAYPQSWYDPGTETFVQNDHNNCYRIDIPVIPDPFIQEEGNIYWLDINMSSMVSLEVGWKTTLDHWNDDGVFQNEPGAEYMELINPLTTESLDFAFVITGNPLPPDSLDFGDAQDPTYPTLLENDGARHIINPAIKLGSSIDAEDNGQPSSDATGDDTDSNDDEDGIRFLAPFYKSMQAALEVNAFSAGYLNIWIDWNIDGDWDDGSEHAITDQYLSAAGNYIINIDIPSNAAAGSTVLRARFSSQSGLNYSGPASDGEVEDYSVEIMDQDLQYKMHYIQWPDTTSYGMDISNSSPFVLADDFLCTKTELITEIVVWSSWYDDITPVPTDFNLSIWSDLPANDPGNPDGYSQPLNNLWSYSIDNGNVLSELYMTVPGEGWFDPVSGSYVYPGDTQIWQYTFIIPGDVAFLQEEGTIYWLGVEATENDYLYGWKSSFNHWNDHAVWSSPTQPWTELIYPPVHELHPMGVDLAFYLNGQLPSAVGILIELQDDRVEISWDSVVGAVNYKIYYSTDPYADYPTGWTYLGQTSSTVWYDGPPLPTDSKRFYKVVAE